MGCGCGKKAKGKKAQNKLTPVSSVLKTKAAENLSKEVADELDISDPEDMEKILAANVIDAVYEQNGRSSGGFGTPH